MVKGVVPGRAAMAPRTPSTATRAPEAVLNPQQLYYRRRAQGVCPECGAAYRSGVSECADCRVALVRRPVETIPGPRESHPEPIIVFESDEPEAVAMARSMLGSAGIRFVTSGTASSDLTGGNPWRGVINPPGARVQFLVRADDAEAAKAVLDVLQSGE